MADTCTLPFLPHTANDGEEVCDKYGNRWRFNLEEETWTSRGSLVPPPTVSEKSDGLVTPTIFDKLSKIRRYLANNQNKPPLKILPGTDAYWYYFRSSDKFIKFRPESENSLRLEIDKSKIFQALMRAICPGSRGPQGDKGPPGSAGEAGPAEVCFQPEITADKLDFAIYTPTPLLGDRSDIILPNNHVPNISVRLFKVVVPQRGTSQKLKLHDQLQNLAIYFHGHDDILPQFQRTRNLLINQSLGLNKQDLLCGLSLSKVLVLPIGSEVRSTPLVTVTIDPLGKVVPSISFDSKYPIDVEKSLSTISYDSTTHIVCGSLYLLNGRPWEGIWCVKSRQQGPDGVQGKSSEAAVRIVECQLDSSNVIATCPIVNARLDCDQNTIFTLCSDLLSEVCVQSVLVPAASGAISDKSALDALFASAQMVLDECKLIYRYRLTIVDDEISDLNLAYWDPQPGCLTQRHFAKQNFDWVSKTTANACEGQAVWYDSNLTARSGKYPNEIISADKPPKDACCQEDFFYCPNIQDSGCTDTGTGSAPPPVPPPPVPPTPPPPPPTSGGTLVGDFTWAPLRPLVGQTVTFTANVTGGTGPFTYLWLFGDEEDSTELNPTHVYVSPGTYRVIFRVTDSTGAIGGNFHNVVVFTGGQPPPPTSPPPPPTSACGRCAGRCDKSAGCGPGDWTIITPCGNGCVCEEPVFGVFGSQFFDNTCLPSSSSLKVMEIQLSKAKSRRWRT